MNRNRTAKAASTMTTIADPVSRRRGVRLVVELVVRSIFSTAGAPHIFIVHRPAGIFGAEFED